MANNKSGKATGAKKGGAQPKKVAPKANSKHQSNVMTKGQFQNGLFGCCGSSSCCMGFCCPCIALGRVNQKIDGLGGFLGGCIGYFLFMIVADVMLYLAAQKVAKKSRIDESPVKSFLKVCCCHCCYLIQIDSEVKHQESAPRQMRMV